jgi:hypothetical protein
MVHYAYVNSLAGVKSVAWLINAWYWKREGKKEHCASGGRTLQWQCRALWL